MVVRLTVAVAGRLTVLVAGRLTVVVERLTVVERGVLTTVVLLRRMTPFSIEASDCLEISCLFGSGRCADCSIAAKQVEKLKLTAKSNTLLIDFISHP
jgi:hypothetical protein